MRPYIWILVALGVLGCSTTSPVDVEDEDTANEIIKAIVRYQLLKQEIPQSVYDEIRDANVPEDLEVVIQEGWKPMSIKVGAVDPNAVTDQLLKDVNAAVKTSGLDPYTLASFNFLGIDIVLTVGGFDTLHRINDATMTIYDTYNYQFDSTVQVYSLVGDFVFSFTFLGLTYQASANAMVDTADADCVYPVSINPVNNATYITVTKLESSNIGRISVEVSGLGPLNPFANVVADIFMNLFKGFIPMFFDGIFLNIVNQVLNSLYPPWQ